MKKMLIIGISVLMIAATASAQTGPGDHTRRERENTSVTDNRLTGRERFQLHRDRDRYKMAEHRSRRDGRVSPRERRRLMHMRRHDRREGFRFRHNRYNRHHHRVI